MVVKPQHAGVQVPYTLIVNGNEMQSKNNYTNFQLENSNNIISVQPVVN